jgi:D-alanyl-D-alanine carboxypeptidase
MTSSANTSNNGTVNTVLGGTLEAAFCGADPDAKSKTTRSVDRPVTEDIAPQVPRP